MRNHLGGGNAMVPHCQSTSLIHVDIADSGTTLDAQKRYADGTKDIIKRFLAGEPQNPVNVIVENGEVSLRSDL